MESPARKGEESLHDRGSQTRLITNRAVYTRTIAKDDSCVKIGRLVHVRLDLATRVRKIPIWSINATSVLKKGMAEVDAVKLRAPRALDTRKEKAKEKGSSDYLRRNPLFALLLL